MFVKVKDKEQLLNVRYIVDLSRRQGGTLAIMQDEQQHWLEKDFTELKYAFETEEHVVPAQPGWEVLYSYTGEGGVGVQREPVLAWRVGKLCAVPITADRTLIDDDDDDVTTVKRPDGTVTDCFGQDWPDVAAWQEKPILKIV